MLTLCLRRESLESLLKKGLPENCLPRINFTMLSYPGTQNLLQSQSKRAWILLLLSAGTGVVHLMLILLAWRMQRKAQRARQGSSDRAEYEAVGMKPKVQWQPKEVANSRNMEQLQAVEWHQPMRDAMWAAINRDTGVGMPKPCVAHILSLCVLHYR